MVVEGEPPWGDPDRIGPVGTDHGKGTGARGTFTAESDAELTDKIKMHRDEFHPQISDEQISEMVTSTAYDE
jgi:hypothetical protein